MYSIIFKVLFVVLLSLIKNGIVEVETTQTRSRKWHYIRIIGQQIREGVTEETKLILSAQRRAHGNMNIVCKYFQGDNTNERRGLLTLSQDACKRSHVLNVRQEMSITAKIINNWEQAIFIGLQTFLDDIFSGQSITKLC